ncbi:WecB/TagA/CpsF family glycosyltransferase [Granulosicoccus sp.]|nr:WecB/TagA/CpsF family glycosyltransferase [Granulosicoccus sp.]MDB4224439.1 WecB/TagA/CpsF family glycosyltransferase [Granulosicoccus sp.]
MSASNYPVYEVFLPKYCALDCEHAAEVIVENAAKNVSFGVTALAVHGLMESYHKSALGLKINRIKMIVPDGQAVVWAMNLLYGLNIKFKLPGPTLTLEVLRVANELSLKIYLFGSTSDTLGKFRDFIQKDYPNLHVVGVHEDRFREATREEDAADILKINESGANIVLVGRGCPRQEHWVADHVDKVDAAMLAVGAAFDYHAGKLNRAPMWIQKMGLEWLYRLIQEPRRLWRRYLVTNCQFIYQLIRHKWLIKPRH